ncbi:Nramp family divalent metal transporter [Geobacter argillaceus]|uniref:Manganese transport protein n=1 Tax=Geobacter argillaceus TaxID=345631 RepID=A0A562VIQ2_9BACT|nr:Nramp family divalent metal transporter [Geobacter argillaceus]TWJ17750.1 manganese transport protein [Geobacter argillaceus]
MGKRGALFGLTERHWAVVSDVLKYVGPGLLVTVGFIDPGNWAANVAAGSLYGYRLLWMVSLSTLMLILLQHNAAHLGIVTGSCLAEAATRHLPPWLSRTALASACMAAAATAMAELLGGAIALQMLFGLPIGVGVLLVLGLVVWLLFGTVYRKLERYIIGFVSLIGLSFIFELWLVRLDWGAAAGGWVTPAFPAGAMPIIMSVLGAVVMPHNLFLHSEVIQSRQWNREDEAVIVHQLKFEFLDTLFSMGVGWAINSAMILMAAATFHVNRLQVTELAQAESMLRPLLGNSAAVVFACALLLAGVASSITAGMAGGSIFAGIFGEPFNSKDVHTRAGILLSLVLGAGAVFFVDNPFKGLIFSQILLSLQLPWTIFLQVSLTSSRKVMGSHVNTPFGSLLLWGVAAIVTVLNVMLLVEWLR